MLDLLINSDDENIFIPSVFIPKTTSPNLFSEKSFISKTKLDNCINISSSFPFKLFKISIL